MKPIFSLFLQLSDILHIENPEDTFSYDETQIRSQLSQFIIRLDSPFLQDKNSGCHYCMY